jgi:hypothetical protein
VYRWYVIAAGANHPGAHIRRERLGRLLEATEHEAIQRAAQLWRARAD